MAEPETPRLCVILDDLGLNELVDFRALGLPHGVTLSILPYGLHARRLADAARAVSHEVFLHMPMQPLGDADPGPGALRLDVSWQENVARLKEALDRIGSVSGVNNHMGSAFSEQEDALCPIMDVLADRDLIFVDSKTSANSRAYHVARACGVRTIENGAFLDNDVDASYLAVQMDLAGRKAVQTGLVVGIAHAHAATIGALPSCLSDLADRGVMLSTIAGVIRPAEHPGPHRRHMSR